jgi:transcriptional regulator with XRE-family HTH domain
VILGRNIAHARKRAGLSQEELAFVASLHRTEIGLLERGERLARADTLLKLSGALGVSVGDFFEGLAWEPGDLRLGRFEFESDECEEDSPGI